MLRGSSWAALCVFSIVGAIALVQAVEPDGYVRFRSDWLPGDGGEIEASLEEGRTLRLGLQPVVLLDDAVLTVSLPANIRIEPTHESWRDRFRTVRTEDGIQVIQADLGSIPTDLLLQIDFRLFAPGGESGVADFRLEATSHAGKPVSEAVGVILGHPGIRPVRRHGAVEFPAVVIPEEAP